MSKIEHPFDQIKSWDEEKLRPGHIRIGNEALQRAIEFVRMEKEIAEYAKDDEALAAWRYEETALMAALDGRGLRQVTP